MPVFERFTERARQVVVMAQQQARDLGHDRLGTEHLLLGLLCVEGGVAAHVLGSFELTLDNARKRVVNIVGPGDPVVSGQIAFTPAAKKTLELSLREALSLGHNYIGTEHILLGLARTKEGAATEILAASGVDYVTVRDKVIALLNDPERPDLAPAGDRAGISASDIPRYPGSRREPRWEYRVEQWPADEPATRQAVLNELGCEGWQLAAVAPNGDRFDWVLQRPLEPRRPPRPPQPRARPRPTGERTVLPESVALTVKSGITLLDLALALRLSTSEIVALLDQSDTRNDRQPLTDAEIETIAQTLGRLVTIEPAATRLRPPTDT